MTKKWAASLIVCIFFFLSVSGCSILKDFIGSDPIGQMLAATVAGTLEHDSSDLYQPTETPVASSDNAYVVFQDDFSDPDSGWELYDGEYGKTYYQDGTYIVESYIKEEYSWGVAGQNYDNVVIDVDATVLDTNSSENDGFGVDCRIQENADGYGFRISSDGYASISIYQDGQGSNLVDWQVSDAVYTDGRTNHLTAICDGSDLSLMVNGELVVQASDDTFSEGDLALSVVSYEDEGTKVAFDNLIAMQMDGSSQGTIVPTQGIYSLTIDNITPFESCSVYIVPTQDEYWGDDLMSEGETIPAGESKTFTGLSGPIVDVKAETCQNLAILELYEIDLSETSSVETADMQLDFEETFDDLTGWDSGVVDGGMISQSNDKYYSISVTEGDKWIAPMADYRGNDLIVQADASLVRVGNDSQGIYGVACRMQEDGSGIYFVVRGDGYASIIKMKDNETTPLTDWQQTTNVNAGIASNYIEGECIDNNFTIFVNGDYLGYAQDDDFTSGKVGVVVYSPAGSTTQADFDYLNVYITQ